MKIWLASIVLFVTSVNLAVAGEDLGAQDGAARVRFFGQAVIGLTYYKNQSCYGGRGVTVSKTGLGGMFGSKKNIVLGIPETANVVNLKQRDGILAAAFFREYSVKAGEPMTILASYEETTGRTGYSCKTFHGFFVPELGKDYEVTLDINSQSCQINVQQIDLLEAKVQLIPVALSEAKKCSN